MSVVAPVIATAVTPAMARRPVTMTLPTAPEPPAAPARMLTCPDPLVPVPDPDVIVTAPPVTLPRAPALPAVMVTAPAAPPVPPVLAAPLPAVMTTLLRGELGFDGLLVSDAMDMAGVVQRFGAAEAAKRAIAAGNDVLLMPADVASTIEAVVAGVAEGRYDEGRIDASVRRVLALKHRFDLPSRRTVDVERVRAIVGSEANQRVADAVATQGFVLAKDSLQLVPLRAGARRLRVLSVTYARRSDLGAGVAFNSEMRSGGQGVRTAFVNADDAVPDFSDVLAQSKSVDVVVLGSYVNITSESATASAPRAFADFVTRLQRQRAKVVLVSCGTPYLLMQVPSIGSYAIAWGGSAASQRASARALLGHAPITARLPISIPPLLSIGAGERRDVAR